MSKKNFTLPNKKTKSLTAPTPAPTPVPTPAPIILATYSQLLALEPRLVFDAAAAATADAVLDLKTEHSQAPTPNSDNSSGEHSSLDVQSGQIEGGQNDTPSEQAEVQNLLRSFGLLQNNAEFAQDEPANTAPNILVDQNIISAGFLRDTNDKGEEQLLITGIQVKNESKPNESNSQEPITVTLQVEQGELTLAEPSDLLVLGNNSNSLTFYGKAADINNLLENSRISYQAPKDDSSSTLPNDKLIFKVSYANEPSQSKEINLYGPNDHSNSLNTKAQSTSDLNSASLNSPSLALDPVLNNQLLNTATLPADGWLGMEGGHIALNGIEVVSPDTNPSDNAAKMFEVTLSLEVGDGMLTVDAAHLGLLSTSNNSSVLAFKGTSAQLNAAFHAIKYTANSNVYDNYKNDGKAADRLNIAVKDLNTNNTSSQSLNLHVLNAQQINTQNQQELKAKEFSPQAQQNLAEQNLVGQNLTAQAFGAQVLGAPMGPFALPEWSEAPEIDFTGSFSVTEDQILNLGGKVTFDDTDSTDFKITISVEHGKLILTYVSDLEGNQYYWADDDPNSPTYHKVVTFAGDKDTCQNALNTLKYQGHKYWNGEDTLTVKVEEGIDGDGYNSAEKAVIKSQNITVTPVPNTPEFTDLPTSGQVGSTGTSNSVWEDTEGTLRFNYGTQDSPDWRPLLAFDPDSLNPEFNDRYNLTLSVNNGTLSSSFDTHSFNAQNSVTLNNLTLEEVNGILANIKFVGEENFYGKANLNISVEDLGNADTLAAPSSPILTKSFEINVLAVNDAPALKPAEENDTSNQIHIKETYPGDADPTQPGVGELLTLDHFHTSYSGSAPDSDGIIKLFDVDNNLSQLVVSITANSSKGDLWREIGGKWVKLGLGSTFSMKDVYEGKVKYVHNPNLQVREDSAGLKFEGSTRDSFQFSLNDGSGAANSIISGLSMHIVIEPVNQAPEVKVEHIPGLIERLDASIVYNSNTGQNETIYTVWGYEGEQGLPFSFKVLDIDQAENSDFTIHISQLPDPSWGYFWYDDGQGGGYQKVTTGTEISLDRMNQGFLRFSHSGAENKTGKMDFKVTVTDDGGGTITRLDTEVNLAINFRSNNDDPEWANSIGSIWDDFEHTLTVDGTRTIPINNSVLKLYDPDSSDVNLTYTVDYNSGEGRLLYSLGGNNYRVYNPGDKVSQAEIDSGKVVWWFNGTGNKQADLTFTVRDGSISATPTPSDKEQISGGINWPAPGGSPTNWEDVPTLTPHEGGIGKWVETSPGNYKWQASEFILHLEATNIPEGGSTDVTPVVDPFPHFEFIDTADGAIGKETLNEGGMLQISDSMFKAWFKNSVNGEDIPYKVWDDDSNSWIVNPDGNPAKLVYRVESYAQRGWLLYSSDGTNFTYLSQYASFSQQDIINGYVYYRHDSNEVFSDAFSFSVSDGRLEAKNTNNSSMFTFKFDMAPVNDNPETEDGADVTVKEHDLPSKQSANYTTPGGSKEINTNNIVVWDVDGNRDKSGQSEFSTKNDLYIVITKLPEHGTLYYNGLEINQALSGPALDAIKAGGGYATWGSDPNMAGIIVIKVTDLTPGSSKLIYEHDGSESFYDDFKFIVSDNKGVELNMVKNPTDPLNLNPGNAGKIHDGSSVNAFEQGVRIVVAPVNDKPESITKLDPLDPDFGSRNNVTLNEAETVALTANNLKYIDRDGSPGAIQFIISDLPAFGKLYLNNKLLGEGSVFTQEDVNLGRVTYVHDGSEHHTDSFKFNISDSIYTSGVNNSDLADIIHINITPLNLAPTITAPKELQVDSIVGGVIINTNVLDPDFGDFQTKPPTSPGYPGDGIVQIPDPDNPGQFLVNHDIMTVTIDLAVGSIVATPPINLDKVHLYFKDGSQGVRTGNTITLTGSYAQIRELLSSVKVQSDPNGGTLPGTAYDPNGDIILNFTVHDGIWDPTANSNAGAWVNPNGGIVGDTVYSADTSVHIFISPINNPPAITNSQGDMSITVNEDCGWVTIVDDSGKAINIEDIDAFKRGGNSITLTVEHGVLSADYAQVDGKSGTIAGRGTNTITIAGTLPEINAILETLKYKPNADYNSINASNVETPDVLKFVYKDNANSGELPVGIINDDANSIYNTPYKYQTGSGKWGIAVNGELSILVKPVNDAPTLQAPSELFLKENHPLNGTDNMGNNIHIEVDDLDASKGNYWVDEINVSLEVTADGWLTLPGSMGSVTSSGEVNTGTPGQYTKITLTGTLNDINNVLAGMSYNRLSWNGDNVDYIKITANDAVAGGSSNGSSDAGSDHDSETKIIKIYCSDSNDPPVLNLPGWIIKEDDAATKIFTGANVISVTDADSFDKQIYVSVSVDVGTLNAQKADLGFNFSGNPALQDKFAISNDGKTITFYASAAKINAALKQISYEAPANYNGEASLTVYANDLGMWGDRGGQSYNPVPAGNPIEVSGSGLVTTQTATISIVAINDAPELNPTLPQVNTKPNVDLSTASTNPVQEDSIAANNTTSLGAKTVEDLFGGSNVFGDTKDTQKDASTNPTGSEANSLAGIVITKNDANASTQGSWQYSANGTSWLDIPTNLSATNALYLAAGTYVRFNPVGEFNGQPGRLTVLLADNSTYDATNNAANPALPGTLVNGGASWSGYDFSDANKIGKTTRFSKDDVYLSTHIKAVNDAPTVKIGQDEQTLGAASEDSSTHTGNTVGGIFTPSLNDQTDNMTGKAITGGSAANGLAGVVVTDNAATTSGNWQYLDGSTWKNIPTNLSDSNGLYLSATTRIRFLPDADWNGTPGKLSVHLVDNSSTASGNPNDNTPPANFSTVNLGVTGTGGTTRFSINTVTLKTSVTAVNDAPRVQDPDTGVPITPGGNINKPSITIAEDLPGGSNPSRDTVKNLFKNYFNDSKDNITNGSNANSFAGILIVGNASNANQGDWEYSNDSGSNWIKIPIIDAANNPNSAMALQAGWSLRFNPKAEYNGNPGALTVRLIDNSTPGTAGAPDSASNNPAIPSADWGTTILCPAVGGVTRYSAETITHKILVTAANDAPLALNDSLTFTEDITYTNTVGELFKNSYDDSKDAQNNTAINPDGGGSEAQTFEGVFITGNAATSTQGAWQYFDGTNWQNVPTSGISDSSAFYLSKNTQIRFVPEPNYNGPVGTLSFRVMEDHPNATINYTSGSGGYDLSGKMGGDKHISGGTAATLTLRVTAVNDAPVVDATTPTVNLPSINEDLADNPSANPGDTLKNLFGTPYFSDQKDNQTANSGSSANTFAGIMVIGGDVNSAKGYWQFSTDLGSSWVYITDNSSLSSALWIPGENTLLRFQPALDYNGEAPQLQVLVVETGHNFTADCGRKNLSTPNATGGSSKVSHEDNPITVKVTVNPINDAPQVVVGKESVSYNTASEDSTTPTAKTVDELFGNSFSDPKDLAGKNLGGANPNAFWGVAIVNDASTNAQGVWQYSLNGTDWINVKGSSGDPTGTSDGVGLNNALILDKNAQLRFLPADNFNGKPGELTVRLIDNHPTDGSHNTLPTAGEIGSKLNLNGTATGGSTNYSNASNQVTLSTTVLPVNDAPIIEPGEDTQYLTVSEDHNANASNRDTVLNIFTPAFNDNKDAVTTAVSGGSQANNLAGIVVTGVDTSNGVWKYSTNGGTSWVEITGVSATSGLVLRSDVLLSFFPETNYNNASALSGLTVRLMDDSGNVASIPATGARVNVSGTVSDGKAGGTTRYSLNEVNLKVNVTPVNDAPTRVETDPVELYAINEDVSSASNSGETLKNLLYKTGQSRFDDSKDTVFGGTSANKFQGILIVGYTEDSSKGQWKYSTNNGSTWTTINDCSLNDALLLNNPDVKLRFEPTLDYNGEPPSLNVRLVEDGTANSWTQTLGASCVLRGDFSAATATGGASAISNASNQLTVKITVQEVNDAPRIQDPGNGNTVVGSLTVSKNHTEDSNTSTKISDLFANTFTDSKDEVTPNGSKADIFAGVIVTGNSATSAQGEWWYETTPNSNNWAQIPTSFSANEGIYLAEGSKVEFRPALNYNGVVGSLEVRLVEKKHDGTPYLVVNNGNTVNVSAGGADNSHISGGTVTLTGSVNAVNDAPIISNPSYPGDESHRLDPVNRNINEDAGLTLPHSTTNPGESVNSLFGTRFNDGKDDQTAFTGGSSLNSLAGILVQNVTNDATKGSWEFYNGSSWVAIVKGTFLRESTLVRFQPVENWNGAAPDLNVYLVENSGDYAGLLPASGTAKTYAYTDNGPFSKETLTLRMTVNAVNDAPVWNDSSFTNRPSHSGSQAPNDSSFLYYGNILAWQSVFIEKTIEEAIKGKNGLVSAFDDSADTVLNGSSANNFKGILITGIEQPMSNLGHWEYYDGISWQALPNDISESNALFLNANTKIHFIYSDDDIPVGTPPHSGLKIATVDTSGENGSGAWSTGSRVTTLQNAGERGGTSAVSETSKLLWVTVTPRNAYPEIDNLGSSTVTERQFGQLSNTIEVSDANLDNGSSNNNWKNAIISISRNGGANHDDSFKAMGNLDTLVEGSNFKYNGTEYGKVIKNSNGILSLQITKANTLASEVNDILRAIAYKNNSHDPAKSIALKWTIDDGNYINNGTYPQGINNPGDSSGKNSYLQTVSIIPVNDAPAAVNDHGVVDVTKGKEVIGNVLPNDEDVDNWNSTFTVVGAQYKDANDTWQTITIGSTVDLKYGRLTINTDGSYTYTLYNLKDPADMAIIDTAAAAELAKLAQGQTLHEFDVQYTMDDGGRKHWDTTANAGLGGWAYNTPHLNASANLALDITRPLPPPPPPVVEYVPQELDNTKLHDNFEEEKKREKQQNQLKDMEVEKPVVYSVNRAYTALRDSVGYNVNTMKGHSIYKLSNPDEAIKRLNNLSLFDRSAILVTKQPNLINFAVGEENQINLPASIFYCCDERERLKYTASMANGEPLPNWLLFNPTYLSFSGIPPEDGAEALDLVIKARTSNGREASVNFTLNLNVKVANETETENLPSDEDLQLNAEPQAEGEQIRLNDEEIASSGLTGQLGSSGQSGLLRAAQDFLKSIQML